MQTQDRLGNFSASMDLEHRETSESFGLGINYTKVVGSGVISSGADLNENGSPTIGVTYTEQF